VPTASLTCDNMPSGVIVPEARLHRQMCISGADFARLQRLPEGGVQRVDIDRASLVAIVRDGILHCYLNRCPHRGTELDWIPGRFLDPAGQHLQCATHGALFDMVSGVCIAGPCHGEALERVVPIAE